MDLPDWRVAGVVCRIWQALADVVEKRPKIKSERASQAAGWVDILAEIGRRDEIKSHPYFLLLRLL